jgi:hypothetical protein
MKLLTKVAASAVYVALVGGASIGATAAGVHLATRSPLTSATAVPPDFQAGTPGSQKGPGGGGPALSWLSQRSRRRSQLWASRRIWPCTLARAPIRLVARGLGSDCGELGCVDSVQRGRSGASASR